MSKNEILGRSRPKIFQLYGLVNTN